MRTHPSRPIRTWPRLRPLAIAVAACGALALGLVPPAAAAAQAVPAVTGAPGRHAVVNGLRTYYEVHGPTRGDAARGDASRLAPPVVLLHGALSTIDLDFGALLPRLARERSVIAIELQGHGRTADRDAPLSHATMADDVAALLEHLGVASADLFGYSMGGAVALQVATRHPALVRKVVAAGGTAYRPEGLYPELAEATRRLAPEQLADTPYEQAYRRLAPDPSRWPALVARVRTLDLTWAGFSAEELRAITAPALLVIGDADIVRPEHTVEMLRLLGGGVPGDLVGVPRSQLAVLPGTTHLGLVRRTEWLHSMVTSFLDAPVPVTAWSVAAEMGAPARRRD